MSESIFEQHEILDKLYVELNRIHQAGEQPTYELLLKIAPQLQVDEYEVIMERYASYMSTKQESDNAKQSLPELSEQLSALQQDFNQRLTQVIDERERQILDNAQHVMHLELERVNGAHAQDIKELLHTQEQLEAELKDKLEAIESLKADNLAKQQRLESMLYDVETLEFLRRISSESGRKALESMPFHPNLNSSLREVISLLGSFSNEQRNALSLLLDKSFNLVKGAQALGFSINDFSAQKTESKDESLTEQQQALAFLKEKFKHIEQLGSDNSYFLEDDSFASQDEAPFMEDADEEEAVEGEGSLDAQAQAMYKAMLSAMESKSASPGQETSAIDLEPSKIAPNATQGDSSPALNASVLAKGLNANPFDANADDVEVINSTVAQAIPRDEGTLVREMINGDSVAAFAAASAKIASLAPMLHEANKDSKSESSVFASKGSALDKDESDKGSSATVEITSVAQDVVKLASELERSSDEKPAKKKVSLFDTSGDNELLGTTVFGAERAKESDHKTDALSQASSEFSSIFGEDSVDDFITGNVTDCAASEIARAKPVQDKDSVAAPKETVVRYHTSTTTSASGKTNIIKNTPVDNGPKIQLASVAHKPNRHSDKVSLSASQIESTYNKNTAIIVNNSASLKELEANQEEVSLMAKDLLGKKDNNTKVSIGDQSKDKRIGSSKVKSESEFAHLKGYQNLDEDGKRRFALLSNIIDERLKERTNKLKALLGEVASNSSMLKAQDMVLFYKSCITSLESQGMLTDELKDALNEKMEYDLKAPESKSAPSKPLEDAQALREPQLVVEADPEPKTIALAEQAGSSAPIAKELTAPAPTEAAAPVNEPQALDSAPESEIAQIEQNQIALNDAKTEPKQVDQVQPESDVESTVEPVADLEPVIVDVTPEQETSVAMDFKEPESASVVSTTLDEAPAEPKLALTMLTLPKLTKDITPTIDQEEFEREHSAKLKDSAPVFKLKDDENSDSPAQGEDDVDKFEEGEFEEEELDPLLTMPMFTPEQLREMLIAKLFGSQGPKDNFTFIENDESEDEGTEDEEDSSETSAPQKRQVTFSTLEEEDNEDELEPEDTESAPHEIMDAAQAEAKTKEEDDSELALEPLAESPVKHESSPQEPDLSAPEEHVESGAGVLNEPENTPSAKAEALDESIASEAKSLEDQESKLSPALNEVEVAPNEEVVAEDKTEPDAKAQVQEVAPSPVESKDAEVTPEAQIQNEAEDDDYGIVITPANEYQGSLKGEDISSPLNQEDSFTLEGSISSYQSPDFMRSDSSVFGNSLGSAYSHPQEATFMFQELKPEALKTSKSQDAKLGSETQDEDKH